LFLTRLSLLLLFPKNGQFGCFEQAIQYLSNDVPTPTPHQSVVMKIINRVNVMDNFGVAENTHGNGFKMAIK
jgi:hypothetical protein